MDTIIRLIDWGIMLLISPLIIFILTTANILGTQYRLFNNNPIIMTLLNYKLYINKNLKKMDYTIFNFNIFISTL